MRQTEYPVLEPEWQQFNQLALCVDAMHIWAASLEAQSKTLLQSDLPEEEWAIGGRFRNSADQLRYWIGRKMLHQVLPAYVGVNLCPIKIAYYEFGKPFLEGREDLKFNLTHSGDEVLLAVSLSEVGIDTEQIKPNFNYIPLLTTCFCAEEIQYIEKSDDRACAFYTMWTRKEAILKKTGKGMSEHLPGINTLSDADTLSWNSAGYCSALSTDNRINELYFYRF